MVVKNKNRCFSTVYFLLVQVKGLVFYEFYAFKNFFTFYFQCFYTL